MMCGQLILGELRTKLWIVRQYYRIALRLFRSIERCNPHEAERLIAVCRKPGATPTGSQSDPPSGEVKGARG